MAAQTRPCSRLGRAAVVLALVAVGCGDDAGSAGPGDAGSETGASTTTDATTTTVGTTGSGETGGSTGGDPAGYEWDLPPGFPEPFVPPDNPMSDEKVELGRFLFYDVQLSGNGTQSCGSCHFQALAFADGLVFPMGSTGDVVPRNSMSLTNSAYSSTLTWVNPTLLELQHQAMVPMFGEFPTELGITGREEEVLDRFRNDPMYQQMFAAAYPDEADPFNFVSIRQAIASFVRTMISGNSPFDQFVYQNDPDAMTPAQIRGMNIFFSENLDCHHCHNGFNFSLSTRTANTVFLEQSFQNTGLYNLDGMGAYPANATGLFEFTGEPQDMGRFRPPTLRNIAVTGPYLHDGSAATLDEVLAIYEAGGREITSGPFIGDGRVNPFKSNFVHGFTITAQERQDVLDFFEALTDDEFLTDPRFSNPFE